MLQLSLPSLLKDTPSILPSLGLSPQKNQKDSTIKRIASIIFKSLATLTMIATGYGFVSTLISPHSWQNYALLSLNMLVFLACYDVFAMVGNVEGPKSEIVINTVKRTSSEDILDGAENTWSAIYQGITDKSLQPLKDLAQDGKVYVILQGTIFGKCWLPAIKIGLYLQENCIRK